MPFLSPVKLSPEVSCGSLLKGPHHPTPTPFTGDSTSWSKPRILLIFHPSLSFVCLQEPLLPPHLQSLETVSWWGPDPCSFFPQPLSAPSPSPAPFLSAGYQPAKALCTSEPTATTCLGSTEGNRNRRTEHPHNKDKTSYQHLESLQTP